MTLTATPARAVVVVEPGGELRGSYVVSDDVVNQGAAGGLGLDQRLTFGPGYRLSGAGSLTYTLSLGTYAPGNSPAIVNGANQQFGGVVQIELGGATPGFGANNHDQINDAATLELLPSSTLSVLPWNNYVPPLSTTFTIMTFQNPLVGAFGSLMIDSFFVSNGRSFVVSVINASGPGSIVLTTVLAVPEASAWLLVGAVVASVGAAAGVRQVKKRRNGVA